MKMLAIIASFLLINSVGGTQDEYNHFFKYALKHYPDISKIEWCINYDNSFNISNQHIEIEAIGSLNDTTFFITFAFFPTDSIVYFSLLEFAEIYSIQDTLFYTSFDSTFTPIFKYKFTEENPENLIFEFGKEFFK